ncbi:protein of unknown function [Thermostaphylospora chromogena]|uniref:DUF4180 domain-containing protein n=1 Tax=Thermostaphylospora chromogena TaxID=35622 RepID=A0A1H1HFZ1_9ACTN|nr:protein of unknown function [Thermostaphylospora chromogena]
MPPCRSGVAGRYPAGTPRAGAAVLETGAEQVLFCAADGPKVDGEHAANDLIGQAWERQATTVVVPAERLDESFFRLRTGVAGAIIQKFVNYRLRLVVLGDISPHLERSSALRAFVAEADRGDQLWFVADADELAARLEQARASSPRP